MIEKPYENVPDSVQILCVHKHHARQLKLGLEKANLIDKLHRMTHCTTVEVSAIPPLSPIDLPHCFCDGDDSRKDCRTTRLADILNSSGDYIAVPVSDKSDWFRILSDNSSFGGKEFVVALGRQICPLSTRTLGNTNEALGRRVETLCNGFINNNLVDTSEMFIRDSNVDNKSPPTELTVLHRVLIDTLRLFVTTNKYEGETRQDEIEFSCLNVISSSRLNLPKRLEKLGDDGTLVIPRKTFSMDEPSDAFGNLVRHFVLPVNTEESRSKNSPDHKTGQERISDFLNLLWSNLARVHASPRVVRRGDIDPNSRTRKSGHVLLWPVASPTSSTESNSVQSYITQEEAWLRLTASPGWITVTEQGIRQSFDLTQVMFSRGNISEKIRFGKVVQKGEVVLDLYAGIGYVVVVTIIYASMVLCCYLMSSLICSWIHHYLP